MGSSRGQRGSFADLAELQSTLAVHPASINTFPGRIGALRAPDPQHRICVIFESRLPAFPLQQQEVNHFLRVVTETFHSIQQLVYLIRPRHGTINKLSMNFSLVSEV